jgi:hypothetical protein
VTTQINAIEISPELVRIAYEMGLNVSKTCENALKEAIRPMQGFIHENNSVRNAEVNFSLISGVRRISMCFP